MRTPIISKIDKALVVFLNKITGPWMLDHDVKMLYDILHSQDMEYEKFVIRTRIGSDRRLNNKTLPYEVFFNEFAIQIKVSADSFELCVVLYHNSKNYFEEFRYSIDTKLNNGAPESNWIFPQEAEGTEPNKFFEEILLLLKQNRDIRIYTEIIPKD